MKSWISSRTSKPANKLLEEDAEVAKEDEATTADVENVVDAEVVVAVEEAVVVVVVEEACSGKTKEKPTAQARSCHDKNGRPLAMTDTCEYVRCAIVQLRAESTSKAKVHEGQNTHSRLADRPCNQNTYHHDINLSS